MLTSSSIKEQIQVIAKKHLMGAEQVTTKQINRFVDQVFSFVKTELDDYLISVSQDTRSRLTEEKHNAFIDHSTGYRKQMEQWIDAHPLKMKKYPIRDEEVRTVWAQQRVQRPAKVLAVGAGSIFILSIFSVPVWLSSAVALATIGLGIKAYQDGAKEDIDFLVRRQQNKIDRLVTQTQNDVLEWLMKAKEASSSIVASIISE